MTQQANYFKLGIFIVLSLILCAVFLIVLGAQNFFKKEILVETFFNETVQGLNIGSPVKYKGIQIGSVTSIASTAKTYEAQSDYIHVVMALPDDVFLGQTGKNTAERVKKAVESGLTVHLAFMGLTGAAFLETDYSQTREKEDLTIDWTPRHIYIPSRPSSMKRFSETLNYIMDTLSTMNITGVVSRLDTLLLSLDETVNELNLAGISFQVETLVKETRQTNRGLKDLIASTDLKSLLSDARLSAARLKEILGQARIPIENTLDDFRETAQNTKRFTRNFETKMMAQLSDMSAALSKITASLEKTAGMIETTVWINSGGLTQTVENLKETSKNLKDLARDLKAYPARLIFESPPEKTFQENHRGPVE